MYPDGYSPSNEDGEVADQVMEKSGDGSPFNEQMIQDYPCGEEPGHYFISSPLNVYSIGRSGSIVLYVEGGCSNFTWASDNAWATFGTAETSVRYNTIESGADEGQDTVVTVTDANGLEVTINVPWNGAASCCEDPPALSFQTLAVELGPFPGEVVVFLDGGCPPFTWGISGTGFTLDYAATNSRRNRVHGTADNEVSVTVEDSCGQTASVSSCDCAGDNVAYDSVNSDETVDQNGTATIIVTGGCGPFTWSVEGTGFSIPASTESRGNTLTADDTACGTATITVTDACGDSCEGIVRCTEGRWVYQGHVCGLSGVGVLLDYSCTDCSRGWSYELILGNKKQLASTLQSCINDGDPPGGYANCIDPDHNPPEVVAWDYYEDYSECSNPEECEEGCAPTQKVWSPQLLYYEWEC